MVSLIIAMICDVPLEHKREVLQIMRLLDCHISYSNHGGMTRLADGVPKNLLAYLGAAPTEDLREMGWTLVHAR